ncbi:MAG: hypothetical protein AAGC70_12240 [Pseudomonadota bacterium]
MRLGTRTILPVALAASVIASATAPSHAKIACSGAYQISGGLHIATPYCEDEYLAKVARKFGVRTSGRLIRASYSEKLSVCRAVGFDTRVREICASIVPSNRNGKNRIYP